MLKLFMLAVLLLGLAGVACAEESNGDYATGALFKRIDTDHDGRVSLQEHLKAAEERAKRSFEHMDSDKDGYISAQEAAAVRGKLRERVQRLRENCSSDK